MTELVTIILSIVTTLGGWEAVKYLINRKTNARISESQADASEFSVLKETNLFLQEQLIQKEKRFAEQTDLVRQLNTDNLELTRKCAKLEAERSLKLCEVRCCPNREPQSGY